MGKTLEEKKQELMKDPEFAKAYNDLKTEFEEARKRIETQKK